MRFVLETSAIAAILQREPEASRLLQALRDASHIALPVHCILEVSLAYRLGPDRLSLLETLQSLSKTRTAGLPDAAAELLQRTALRYGKGSGSGAGLNFGDCMSYAVARHLKLPLLYVGEAFARTDIPSAIDWTTA